MALIIKEKEDKTIKRRIVIDLRRSRIASLRVSRNQGGRGLGLGGVAVWIQGSAIVDGTFVSGFGEAAIKHGEVVGV